MLLAPLLALLLAAPQEPSVTLSRSAMGVRFEIVLVGVDEGRALELGEACYAEVDRLENLLGIWTENSALRRLNATRGTDPQTVPIELGQVLSAALEWCEGSGGAFDPTIGAVLEVLGYYTQGGGHLPLGGELEELRARVGCGTVRVVLAEDGSAASVLRSVQGVVLDLSAVAKGWVVDRIVEQLRAAGVSNGLVRAGPSAMRGFGAGPAGDGWAVEVARVAGEPVTWWLRDEALAVSGQRSFTVPLEGEQQSHIVDPRSLATVEHETRGASVLSATCAQADMLSTTVLVLGAEEAQAWLRGLGADSPARRVLVALGTGELHRVREFTLLAEDQTVGDAK